MCEHYISVLEETVLYSISVLEERRCSESDAQHSYGYKKPRLNARHILSVLQYQVSTKHVLRATYLAKTCIISIISENDNKALQLLCACSINGLMNMYNCCRFSLCTKNTPYSFPYRMAFFYLVTTCRVYVYIYSHTYTRVWINRVRLPTLLVIS